MEFYGPVWREAMNGVREEKQRGTYKPEMFSVVDDHIAKPPEVILEVGAYKGQWVKEMAAHFPEAMVYAIGEWQGRSGFRAFMRLQGRNKDTVWRRVIPLFGPYRFWAHAFPLKVNVLMLNFDKSEMFDPEVYFHTAKSWHSRVAQGGVFMCRDVTIPGVEEAVAEVFAGMGRVASYGRGKVRTYWKRK